MDMQAKWWQTPQVSILWTVIRVWLGIQWMTSGFHKLAGGFDATGFLQGAIAKATGEHPAVQGWYAAFLEHVALPNVGFFNFIIPVGEFLAGLALILGVATIPALLAGMFMNLNFMLAGTTSTNPIIYTLEMILLFTGKGSYYWGVDRFAIPYLKQWMKQHFHHGNGENKEKVSA